MTPQFIAGVQRPHIPQEPFQRFQKEQRDGADETDESVLEEEFGFFPPQ